MSDSLESPWSYNPNAPQIPYRVYRIEKENLAGNLIATILYGVVIAMFFQCMGALLNPTSRTKEGTKWVLVAHTVLMFSFATINTAMSLDVLSVSYIDNRAFSVIGPLAYQDAELTSEPIFVVPGSMFQLNQWLADGLLLHRCYIICGMNYWVIALPCLMYFASVGTGILLIYQAFRPDSIPNYWVDMHNFSVSYYSISLSLNILLTLMIILRLALHNKNIRSTMGGKSISGGLYRAIIVMLIESFALYSVSFLLFEVLNATHNRALAIFDQIVPMTQVIAPFHIVLRVADRRALTSEDVASGNLSSIDFGSRAESADDDGTTYDENLTGSIEIGGETPSRSSVGVENSIKETPR